MIATESSLRLNQLTIENFMRVEALQVDAHGHHVEISGPNASGKTSAVDAIWAGLGGKSAKEMPEPVHRGADRATVRLDLGEYLVESIWKDRERRLIVTAADGSKVAKPQALLDGLLGKYALDPVAFLDRRPQDQVDDVLAIAGVTPPVDQVEHLTGEAHPPLPAESADHYIMRLSADQTGLYYVRRREAHRTLEQKKAALEDQRQTLEATGGPILPDEQEQSASELLARIEQLQQKADQRRAVVGHAGSVRQEHQAAADKLRELSEHHRREQEAIAHLEAELARRKEGLGTLAQRITRGQDVVKDLAAEQDAADEAVSRLPDPAPQIAALRQQVRTVETSNARQAKRRLLTEQLQATARHVEMALGEHRRLDDLLAALRDLRAHLLDGVDLGVPGLEVGMGELRLNGVSFRQASQAEQVRVACAVAMRQKPRLRLLRVDEAERLDSHSTEMLLRLADEHGWQVVMTRVRDSEALRVEIMEGLVRD